MFAKRLNVLSVVSLLTIGGYVFAKRLNILLVGWLLTTGG